MATRTQLLADPRSGARPLSGSPGPADVEDEGQADVEDEGQAADAGQPEAAAPAAILPAAQDDDDGQGAAAAAPAAAPAPAAAGGRAPAQPARKRRAGHALGGVVVGLFGWAFAMNWIRGGKAQAFGWVGAKFINVPYTAGEVPGGTGFPTPSGNLPAPQQITQQVAQTV
jgi:hypothetical protein